MPGEHPGGAPIQMAAGPRIPLASYRLQFNRHFTFDDAARLVPYLHALGISDLYASSYFAAHPGSLHGYDIVDHSALNPEIGSREAYDRMAAALDARGMGQILDVVPNHMGIARGANAWWNDVLENGPSSPYAEFFDIDWRPVAPHLADKVLLPILGDQYGRALENQELVLALDEGRFRIRYGETLLPVDPRSETIVLEHGLPLLAAALGEHHPEVQEYQSIITALGNLPLTTETAPDRVRERMREKEVARRRLNQLVHAVPAVRACLDETLAAFNGQRGDPRSSTGSCPSNPIASPTGGWRARRSTTDASSTSMSWRPSGWRCRPCFVPPMACSSSWWPPAPSPASGSITRTGSTSRGGTFSGSRASASRSSRGRIGPPWPRIRPRSRPR